MMVYFRKAMIKTIETICLCKREDLKRSNFAQPSAT